MMATARLIVLLTVVWLAAAMGVEAKAEIIGQWYATPVARRLIGMRSPRPSSPLVVATHRWPSLSSASPVSRLTARSRAQAACVLEVALA